MKLPALRQSVVCLAALAVWLIVTALFVGFRPEHAVLALLLAAMFFITPASRRLAVALLPFFIFGISYDWMNIVPNYMVNPVDTEGLYNTEKALFGIHAGSSVLTPNEYFGLHRFDVADLFAGVFYLCWVPLPIFYGLWLYFSGKKGAYLHFAIVFLLVNLIGFAFYYVHPAAPPWYVAMHGFEAVPGTPGSVAGLDGFGRITGWNVFEGLYARNSNVFAAMPSLHSAYTLVAFIYAVRIPSSAWWRWILGVVTVGIWITAVYTSHHYILDVLGGIGCAVAGFAIFEYVLMRIPAFSRFITRYKEFIR
ncbi:MAG: phosphatase PAP2 family protein [Muribaculaceae bacterium]|nr:phosphatase PAP2 family protein [Muribaculaceae bacterium]MDE6332741.1 phosphatase PAP2 family protein [Muribaculaceae bacterium]